MPPIPTPDRNVQQIPSEIGWGLGDLFVAEKTRLDQWIFEQSGEDLSAYDRKVPPNAGARVVSQIEQMYATQHETPPLALLPKYNKIVDDAPSSASIWTFTALLLFVGLAEFAVGVVTWVFASRSGEGTGASIIVGILLVTFGWLLGYGMKVLFTNKARKAETVSNPDKKAYGQRMWGGVAMALGGLLGITVLALLRSGVLTGDVVALGVGLHVVGITTLLAFMVAFFEMLRGMAKEKRDKARRDAFTCQIYNATQWHKKNLPNYRKDYDQAVETQSNDGNAVHMTQGAGATGTPPVQPPRTH